MLRDEWKRIAGLEQPDDGNYAAVWLALDKTNDVLHLYDCCMFRSEVLAVIAEGLNARGRFIPIAWPKAAKELSEKLRDRGCNMLPEGVDDKQPSAELVSRDISERLRTGRLKVDARLSEWLNEFRSFFRKDAKVPIEGHPLMSATRHAVLSLEFARPLSSFGSKKRNAPKVTII